MAEVLRVVVAAVEPRPLRTEPDPVVLRGITLAPKHGVEVSVVRLLGDAQPKGALAVAGA